MRAKTVTNKMRYAPISTPEKKRTTILTGLLTTNITLVNTIRSHTTIWSVVMRYHFTIGSVMQA